MIPILHRSGPPRASITRSCLACRRQRPNRLTNSADCLRPRLVAASFLNHEAHLRVTPCGLAIVLTAGVAQSGPNAGIGVGVGCDSLAQKPLNFYPAGRLISVLFDEHVEQRVDVPGPLFRVCYP